MSRTIAALISGGIGGFVATAGGYHGKPGKGVLDPDLLLDALSAVMADAPEPEDVISRHDRAARRLQIAAGTLGAALILILADAPFRLIQVLLAVGSAALILAAVDVARVMGGLGRTWRRRDEGDDEDG